MASNGNPFSTAAALQELTRTQVVLPRTEQWVMESRHERRKYQISVATPIQPPPPGGYPVIYLLDGNSVFATMTEAMRMQCHRPDKTGVLPAVIVGIGYQTEAAFSPDRYYDFTPIATSEYSQKSDGTPLPKQGGAAGFLQFIEEELKPEIQRQFQIDATRQTLFGHSLGGLFTLHVLFTRPTAFQCYIAGSPSIHWIKPYLLEEEEQFVSGLQHKQQEVEVLITMGELEKGHVSGNLDQAKEMAQRLARLKEQGVNSQYVEFEGEGHVSVLLPLISRALRFALRPLKN